MKPGTRRVRQWLIYTVLAAVLAVGLALQTRLKTRTSPLQDLIELGSAEDLRDALRNGADPWENVTVVLGGESFSCTTFGAALLRGQPELLAPFFEAGCTVNSVLSIQYPGQPPTITTPLMLAMKAMGEHTAPLAFGDWLIGQGADVNMPDGFGHTPLFVAAEYRLVPTAEALLEDGADANAVTPEGMNALHPAAALGDEEMVSLLLAWGADPEQRDHSGRLPRDYAREMGETALLELLDPSSEEGEPGAETPDNTAGEEDVSSRLN